MCEIRQVVDIRIQCHTHDYKIVPNVQKGTARYKKWSVNWALLNCEHYWQYSTNEMVLSNHSIKSKGAASKLNIFYNSLYMISHIIWVIVGFNKHMVCINCLPLKLMFCGCTVIYLVFSQMVCSFYIELSQVMRPACTIKFQRQMSTEWMETQEFASPKKKLKQLQMIMLMVFFNSERVVYISISTEE